MPVRVGDVIMAVRSLIPDMPFTLPTPPPPVLADASPGTLPPYIYYVRTTVSTPWGESDCSPEVAIGSAAAPVSGFSVSAASFTPGATSISVYWGTAPGQQSQVLRSSASPTVVSAPGTVASPPLINRAYVADADGYVFPALTLFSWLGEALRQGSDLSGGIYDATGVPSASGVAMYQLTGDWKKMTHCWHDGYPMGMGNKSDAFIRNKITSSLAGICMTEMRGKRAIVSLWPVPSRPAGSGLLSLDIPAEATVLPLDSTSTYLLPYGLAQIGPSATQPAEVIVYQTLGDLGIAPPLSGLGGVLRGMGGTKPQPWPMGTPVAECNIRFSGYRYGVGPSPGDALLELDAPPGWDLKLQLYMESRYREAERRFPEAAKLRDQFEKEMRSLGSAAKNLLGPRQVGEGYINEVYGAGALMGGGWLLP